MREWMCVCVYVCGSACVYVCVCVVSLGKVLYSHCLSSPSCKWVPGESWGPSDDLMSSSGRGHALWVQVGYLMPTPTVAPCQYSSPAL